MALSPNYSWAEPDNSSLVKNGAADIRTLGDAIDTSVWNVGYGQAGKNKIINGAFDVWQRGTSFTPTTGSFSADRFYNVFNGSGSTRNVSRQTFTPGTAPVAGYEANYFLRYAVTVAGSGEGYSTISQNIEDARTFAGQTVTFSFYAKAASSITLPAVYAVQRFGSGGSAEVATTVASNVAVTTSWQRFTYTFTMPSVSGKTIGTSSYVDMEFYTPLNSTFTLDTWGWQLEYGSKATPFQTATGTIQGELAACQRYYRKSYQQGTAPATATAGAGLIVAATSASVANNDNYNSVNFSNPMRTAPTVTIYPYTTPTNTARVSDGAGTDLAAGSGTVVLTGDSGFYLKNGSGGAISSSVGVIVFHYQAEAEF